MKQAKPDSGTAGAQQKAADEPILDSLAGPKLAAFLRTRFGRVVGTLGATTAALGLVFLVASRYRDEEKGPIIDQGAVPAALAHMPLSRYNTARTVDDAICARFDIDKWANGYFVWVTPDENGDAHAEKLVLISETDITGPGGSDINKVAVLDIPGSTPQLDEVVAFFDEIYYDTRSGKSDFFAQIPGLGHKGILACVSRNDPGLLGGGAVKGRIPEVGLGFSVDMDDFSQEIVRPGPWPSHYDRASNGVVVSIEAPTAAKVEPSQ